MASVHARFWLGEVKPCTGSYAAPDAEESTIVEGAIVRLNAVQGDPFGAATPFGRLDMSILNPEAAKVFVHAPYGQEFDVILIPRNQKENVDTPPG